MDISEMFFYAQHPEEREEQEQIVHEIKDKFVEKHEMKFDVSFLLYLIPEEHEWILSLIDKSQLIEG